MMHSSNSVSALSEEVFRNFDFKQFELLFVENRLVAWQKEIDDSSGRDSHSITSLERFFQPGYIHTQMEAFFWGLDQMPEVINFAWINNLHHLATKGLYHETVDSLTGDFLEIPKTVRNTLTYLGFSSPFIMELGASLKASHDGILSLAKDLTDVDDIETQNKIYFYIDNDFGQDSLQVIDAQIASEYFSKQQELYHLHKNRIKDLCAQAHLNPAALFMASFAYTLEQEEAILKIEDELIELNSTPLLTTVGYVLLNKNPFQIRYKAERMIDRYNQNIQMAQHEDDKIKVIINLVKGLLNLHVWPDGNGRLCAHQLLNLLLIKNQLTPALLNNNCLDAFTHDELLARVHEGMHMFREKCNADSNLEKFRAENKFVHSRETVFTLKILNNKYDEAIAHLDKTGAMTRKDIEMFICCKDANVEWVKYFYAKHGKLQIENNSYYEDQLINLLLSLSIDYANENLLLNALQFVADNEIFSEIATKQFKKVLQFGGLRANEFLFAHWENIVKRFNNNELLEIIAQCQNEERSLALLERFKDLNHRSNKQPWKVINISKIQSALSTAFSEQSSTVINAIIQLDIIQNQLRLHEMEKEYGGNPQIILFIERIKSRYDLSSEEKNQLIQALDTDYSLTPSNPLDDFDASTQLESSPKLPT